MQISITAGIPGNERRREHSENTKNPEMTESDTDHMKTQRRYWGTREHGNWQNLGMNDTDNKPGQADTEK